ncbi:hypothetical protein EVAR_6790_1 [Eumeta japonica]|uniref:Uncharacterized protein n=1 Tax=Eumeta variegata TaxID=151549 RepID=A0A4C1U6A9_EUMVA|nr:hypothetical protein EVAR_6790_1 [Eumeta japonica]
MINSIAQLLPGDGRIGLKLTSFCRLNRHETRHFQCKRYEKVVVYPQCYYYIHISIDIRLNVQESHIARSSHTNTYHETALSQRDFLFSGGVWDGRAEMEVVVGEVLFCLVNRRQTRRRYIIPLGSEMRAGIKSIAESVFKVKLASQWRLELGSELRAGIKLIAESVFEVKLASQWRLELGSELRAGIKLIAKSAFKVELASQWRLELGSELRA